jgi:UDP-N-acetyl-D-mannosaminuronate dehydrogenase
MGFNGSSSVEAISVLGIGKLGAVVAGCHASRGFPVIGVDVNRDSVESCNRGVPPIQNQELRISTVRAKDFSQRRQTAPLP